MSESHVANRTTVALYVCTYRRNEQLIRLLETVRVAAAKAAHVAAVGVVVVDDNLDGRALGVAQRFDDAFELGVHYRHTGSGNISVARNTGLETGAALAEWVAMTDDDCEVSPQWLVELLRVQQMTGADAVIGPHVRRAPDDAPKWLIEHPFLQPADQHPAPSDGGVPDHGQTNNSMIRSEFVLAHPEVRFDLKLGTLGGEDVVFYHEAVENGLRMRFAREAVVYEEAEGERLTLNYYLRAGLWFGNTMYVTSSRTEGIGRRRATLRGGKRILEAIGRPLRQLLHRRPPEFTFALSQVATGLGLIAGALGIEVRHPS